MAQSDATCHLLEQLCQLVIYTAGQRQYSHASWCNPAKDMGDGNIQDKKADRKFSRPGDYIPPLAGSTD